MDETAILNYPGSKKRLLEFIYDNTHGFLGKDSAVLDIFCGAGSVSAMFHNRGYRVYANDSENYSYNITHALLNGVKGRVNKGLLLQSYHENLNKLEDVFGDKVKQETALLSNKDTELTQFDLLLPKIWQENAQIKLGNHEIRNESELKVYANELPYCLFVLYYSGYYFGLKQCMDIDSLRYAIDNQQSNREVLLTCLYYAMKEATFSKDGHMAQPLNHEKNTPRLFKCRERDVLSLFMAKLDEFIERAPSSSSSSPSCVYNKSFDELISDTSLLEKVDLIYADPPYTDMQYSRYFHLLNTVTSYDYPLLTRKSGRITSGLYADNRFQSKISNRRTALTELAKLMDSANQHNCVLAFSYAFPVNPEKQAIDRYTMHIDDLIGAMRSTFPKVDVAKENFKHCNNRNSSAKEVFEYIITGLPRR